MYKILFLVLFVFSNLCMAQSSHSQFKFDCSLCHSCENPTKLNPCLKMCPRLEIITVHHKADEGPENILLDRFKEVEDNFPPLLFSHRAHAEMSDMAGGCEMCHHYNPPGRIVPCSECHVANRIREDLRLPDLKGAFHRQCIDCHKLWASQVECSDCHLENGMEDSESIGMSKDRKSIHPRIEEPERVVYETEEMDGFVTFYHSDHVNVFSNECNDCHKQESCARCHTEEDLLKNVKLSSEEKHLACSSCHDTEDNCESCHKEEIVSGFDHLVSTGFNVSKYHKNVECESCHKEAKIFRGLKQSCASCHKDWSSENFDHKITGLLLDDNHIENECVDCHIENEFNKPTCDNCHDEITYPQSKPGKIIK